MFCGEVVKLVNCSRELQRRYLHNPDRASESPRILFVDADEVSLPVYYHIRKVPMKAISFEIYSDYPLILMKINVLIQRESVCDHTYPDLQILYKKTPSARAPPPSKSGVHSTFHDALCYPPT